MPLEKMEEVVGLMNQTGGVGMRGANRGQKKQEYTVAELCREVEEMGRIH